MQGMLMKPWKIKVIQENPDKEWQTRRLDHLKEINQEPNRWECGAIFEGQIRFYNSKSRKAITIKPRYQAGEVVYIKEAWAISTFYDPYPPSHEIIKGDFTIPMFYLLDGTKPEWCGRTRSPLHLPEERARTFIKIKDVKPQRLQSITSEDCLAEGIVDSSQWQSLDYKPPEPLHPGDLSNKEADKETERGWVAYTKQVYAALWDSINPGFPWSGNWWVWRYCFEALSPDK